MSALEELKYAEATEVDYFSEWCEENLRHSVDRWAGKPVIWEPWQLEFFEEAMSCNEHGIPYWSNVALVVPRKNGKTLMLAAWAMYRLILDDDQPEILLAAATDKQAGRLFEQCINFLRKNPKLDRLVHRRESFGEIVNTQTGGKIIRLPSSGETLDGFNPSLAICDELHAWGTPTRRRVWTSLNTGDAARERVQIVAITTAGNASDRSTGILGKMIDANEAAGECEREPGITISRNHAAKTILYNYSAPTKDPSNVEAMKLANPASWITTDFLARKAANPELSNSEVLQLHGCVWAEAVEAWISLEAWENCRRKPIDCVIPNEADVYVGVDIGLTHDSSAVAVAWVHDGSWDDEEDMVHRDEGAVVISTTVWSAIPGQPADVTVPGGKMDLELIEDHIRYIGERYNIVEVAYDPRFFERGAQSLADEFVMVQMNQNSAPMYDAYQAWYQVITEGRLRHDGDGVLSSHVFATAAQKTERGWKISKIRSSQRIDAVPAGAMAVYRAEVNANVDGGVVYG